MTRQEFIEEVTSFGDLIMVCQDHGIDICDDIYDADYLNEIILDLARTSRSWLNLRDLVQDIPTDSLYYREDGYGGYEDADYCFDDYKEDVLQHMDSYAEWDERDDEEEEKNCAPSIYAVDEEEEIDAGNFMEILGVAV